MEMKKNLAVFVILVLIASMLAYTPARSQQAVSGSQYSDPCASPFVAKQSVQLNITTATTTALVAVSGTTQVYSCGLDISALDTVAANTVQLEYGTGAACAAAVVALTPVYNTGVQAAGAIPFQKTLGFSLSSFVKPTPPANGVCILSTVGTTPSINILYTFVQI